MQPKKILHVVSASDFIYHFLQEHIDYCNLQGHKVYVACTPDRLLYELNKSDNFTILPIYIIRSYTPIADFIAIKKLRRVIRNLKFDIVIGHTPKGALLSMIASRLENVNVRVYYRHGILYQTATGIKRLLLKCLEKITANCATNIINVSKSVEEFAYLDDLNNAKKNIFLSTNGSCGAFNPLLFSRNLIDEESINEFKKVNNISSNEIIIGYFGRMVNDKGINELIKAWELLKKKYTNIKLVLAGVYENRNSIPKKTKLRIATIPSIIYFEYFTDIELLYSILNIFILPSYREGMPTVILEASSMEIPVITTRATGCIDAILENETGIFCTHDPQNIADKISFYIDHPELRKVHGQNGRNFVLSHFDQAKIWQDFENKVINL